MAENGTIQVQAVQTPDTDKALVPRAALRPLMARSNGPATRWLIGLVLALVATGSLVAATRDQWLVWPAMFLMGVVWVHLFAAQHECAHGTAFRSQRANAVVSWICGALILVPEVHFKYEHTDHHTHTHVIGMDSELIPLPDSWGGYLWYLSGLPYWWSNGLGLVRRARGVLTAEETGFIPASECGKVLQEARWLLLFYVIVVIAILAGANELLIYWLVPMLLGQPVMRFIRMTEHVGCPHEPDPTRNTRTTRVALPWRLLAWNMNFHGEHHLAPLVPFHALPALNRLVEGRIAVRDGYVGAHREIWAGIRRGAAQQT